MESMHKNLLSTAKFSSPKLKEAYFLLAIIKNKLWEPLSSNSRSSCSFKDNVIKGGDERLPHVLKQLYICCYCHELGILVNIGCSWSVSSWLRGITSSLVRQKTEKAYIVDRRQSKEHSAINAKECLNFHSQYCPTPLLHHLFVPSLPTPDTTDMDFVDTFLAFRKRVLLLITTFCI